MPTMSGMWGRVVDAVKRWTSERDGEGGPHVGQRAPDEPGFGRPTGAEQRPEDESGRRAPGPDEDRPDEEDRRDRLGDGPRRHGEQLGARPTTRSRSSVMARRLGSAM
ncbi:hypothetical protein [Glycomyces tenuis]|uniref:hypothetical protein n=1 Tax=Glycomyces tenuis TaxID=58116 RepID=UPI0014706FBB